MRRREARQGKGQGMARQGKTTYYLFRDGEHHGRLGGSQAKLKRDVVLDRAPTLSSPCCAVYSLPRPIIVVVVVVAPPTANCARIQLRVAKKQRYGRGRWDDTERDELRARTHLVHTHQCSDGQRTSIHFDAIPQKQKIE